MSTGSAESGEYLSTNSANSGSSGHHSNRHNATFVENMGGQPDMAGMPRGLSHKTRGYRDRTEAWWSMGEFLNPGHNGGLTHQSTKFSLTGNRVFNGNHQEELWDLSDSLAELHDTVNRSSVTDSLQLRQQQDRDVNIKEWLESDVGSGFIRVFPPNVNSYATSYLIPCTLTTTAHQVCLMLGISLNSLHVQYNGDIIQRLDTYEHPLMLQNEYLVSIGYCDLDRIQEEGTSEDLGYLIRFYYGMCASFFRWTPLFMYPLNVFKCGIQICIFILFKISFVKMYSFISLLKFIVQHPKQLCLLPCMGH